MKIITKFLKSLWYGADNLRLMKEVEVLKKRNELLTAASLGEKELYRMNLTMLRNRLAKLNLDEDEEDEPEAEKTTLEAQSEPFPCLYPAPVEIEKPLISIPTQEILLEEKLKELKPAPKIQMETREHIVSWTENKRKKEAAFDTKEEALAERNRLRIETDTQAKYEYK